MAQKGQINISLPEDIVERIKTVQKKMGVKINPTGYVREIVKSELEQDELILKTSDEYEEKKAKVWDDVIEKLKEKGEDELIEKLEQYMYLEAEELDKLTE